MKEASENIHKSGANTDRRMFHDAKEAFHAATGQEHMGRFSFDFMEG